MEKTHASLLALGPCYRVVMASALTSLSFFLQTEKTHNPPSPEGPVVEVEVKADKSQWSAFSHDRSVWTIRPVKGATPSFTPTPKECISLWLPSVFYMCYLSQSSPKL